MEELEDKVHLKNLAFSEVHIEVGLVPAVHVLWEDKSNTRVKGTAGSPSSISSSTGSSFTSSRSSFASSSSLGSSSSFADKYRSEQKAKVDKEESAETEEELPEIEVEPEMPAENESEDPTKATEEPSKKPSGPPVAAGTRDSEDDKWADFPDVSFPTTD